MTNEELLEQTREAYNTAETKAEKRAIMRALQEKIPREELMEIFRARLHKRGQQRIAKRAAQGKDKEPKADALNTICPRCGSTRTLPIAYGYPSPEMWEEKRQGKIVFGGCRIEIDDNGNNVMPNKACTNCGYRWRK